MGRTCRIVDADAQGRDIMLADHIGPREPLLVMTRRAIGFYGPHQ